MLESAQEVNDMDGEENGDLNERCAVPTNEGTTCPECGGTEFTEDSNRGEIVCVMDGVVIHSNVLEDSDVFQGVSNIENIGRDLGNRGRDLYARSDKNRLGSCPYATMNGHINGSASAATRAYHRRILTIQRNQLAERPTLRRNAQRIIESSRMPGESSVKDIANRILVETHDKNSEHRHSSDRELAEKMKEGNGGEKPPYPLNQVRHLQALTKTEDEGKKTIRNNKGDSATVAAIAAMSIAARMLGKSFSITSVAKEYGLDAKVIHTEKKNILSYLKAILSAERELNRTSSVLCFDASQIMGQRRWTESEILAILEAVGPSMESIHGAKEGRKLVRLLGDLLRVASQDRGLSGENLRAVAASFCDRMNKYNGRQRVFKTIGSALSVSRNRVKTVTDKFGGLINRLIANVIES
ncbi:MAG TPA: TFIIB-type zinc ribbon-containing protein [Candidatus Thalassarchaeaceae archaeon]|nr:MAG TPA: TFIIB-type zinc ribbon-containing protein [Candidatus Poseidoniales archaeon]HII49105.1 TFIIB-type zinc ribbon-containing protein [Candidatus Thalassarchaeaceae archaeon]